MWTLMSPRFEVGMLLADGGPGSGAINLASSPAPISPGRSKPLPPFSFPTSGLGTREWDGRNDDFFARPAGACYAGGMTEADWLASGEPRAMLDFQHGKISQRKY